MPSTETPTFDDSHGISHPCLTRCGDPCLADCCCAESSIPVCVEYAQCGDPLTTTCEPSECVHWVSVRLYDLSVPYCLQKRADAKGGFGDAYIYAGLLDAFDCQNFPIEPDRIVDAVTLQQGACDLPPVTLTREDFLPATCGYCLPCADYKVMVVWRAADASVLLCCELCIELCDGASCSSSS